MEPKQGDDEARRDEDERAAELLRQFRERQAQRAAEHQARDAEARAKREAEEAARQAEENERAIALFRQRQADDARKQAEEAERQAAEAQAREETLQRTLAEAERLRKEIEDKALRDQRAKESAVKLRQEMVQRTRTPVGTRRTGERSRRTVLVLSVLFVLGVAVLHFVTFDGASFERAASARFGVPVKISATRFSTLPLPALHFEHVTIGSAAEVKIDRVTVKAGLRTILDAKKHFAQVELDGAHIPLAWLTAAIWEKDPGDALHIERLIARESAISVPGFEPIVFNGEAKFDHAGALRSLQAETPDRSKTFSVEMQSGKAEVTYSAAKPLTLPIAGLPQFDNFAAAGTLTSTELVISKFDANALGGSFVGNARLTWGAGWSLDGAFLALSMDPARIAAPLVASGRLEGKGTFSMRAPSAAELVENARLDGNFAVHRGTLGFVDLTRVLQGSATRGGSTPFTKMDGTASFSHGTVHLRQVRLNAGLLNAAGDVVVDPQKNLDGRLRIEITSLGSAAVTLGGTVAAPQVRR